MGNLFNYSKLKDCMILFIDMQEKLINAMPEQITEVISRQQKLLKGAALLNIPVLITEQYPKGLGGTFNLLKNCFLKDWQILEKSTFSCLGSNAIKEAILGFNKKTIIIVGIETHVCVLQTALDCLNEKLHVVILKDAVCSRNEIDMRTAFLTASDAGISFLTVESFLFMMLQDSAHPKFRELSKILVSQ